MKGHWKRKRGRLGGYVELKFLVSLILSFMRFSIIEQITTLPQLIRTVEQNNQAMIDFNEVLPLSSVRLFGITFKS